MLSKSGVRLIGVEMIGIILLCQVCIGVGDVARVRELILRISRRVLQIVPHVAERGLLEVRGSVQVLIRVAENLLPEICPRVYVSRRVTEFRLPKICFRAEVLNRVAVFLLSYARTVLQIVALILKLLLDEPRVNLVCVYRVVVSLLNQIRAAVDFQPKIIQLLQSHFGVLAVGRYRVAPFVLRKILRSGYVVEKILSGNIGGIFCNVVKSRVGHGRIQDAAKSQLVDGRAQSSLQRDGD